MYKRILVPLDGSKLAECALPHAESLATGCAAEKIILVSVTERVQGYRPIEDHGQPVIQRERLVPEAVGKLQKQAEKYLSRIAKGMEARGISVETDVLLGSPADEIIMYANEPGADIIVISSHGRSGVSRWAYGSVADRIFRASCVPVLMIRAPGCIPGF